MNLISRDTYKSYAGIAITNTTKDSLIDLIITMVSSAIKSYLKRDLEQKTYKIWLNGTGSNRLFLPNYPLVALYQVSVGTYTAATIQNNSSTHASVSFDGTKLMLISVDEGVDTIHELEVSTYKTLGELCNAVNAKSGWLFSINGDYASRSASFIRPIYSQLSFNNRSADIVLPDTPMAATVADIDYGRIELVYPNDFAIYQADAPITPRNYGSGFPSGIANIFVWYKAGWVLPTGVPEALTMLTCQMVSEVIGSRSLNTNLASESLPGYSYSLRTAANGAVGSIVENHKHDLRRFMRMTA